MIMKNLSTVSLIAATLTTGMVAGLMADWAYTVLPGLGRSSDRTFVEAVQHLNRAIQNGWFFLSSWARSCSAGWRRISLGAGTAGTPYRGSSPDWRSTW